MALASESDVVKMKNVIRRNPKSTIGVKSIRVDNFFPLVAFFVLLLRFISAIKFLSEMPVEINSTILPLRTLWLWREVHVLVRFYNSTISGVKN